MIGSRTSARRGAQRAHYYLRNFARDAMPQALFRSRLGTLLKQAAGFDPASMSARLDYYNKLTPPAPIPENAPRIGAIPMKHSFYYYDLKEHARYFPRNLRIAHVFGDAWFVPDAPSIVKSRPIAGDNANAVLLNLDKFRHFNFPPDPIPFADKRPSAVWRGAMQTEARRAFVNRFVADPRHDIGHTSDSEDPATRKPFMPPAEQMRHRYVLSIEGYDVATNLKWILASNALCLMAPPRFETWFMEGRLEAGTHFAALRQDYADLDDKIAYYETHHDEALAIIRNAQAHVAQFQDARREQILSLLVLYKYFVTTGQMARIDGVPLV